MANGFSTVKKYVGHGIGSDLHEDPNVPNFGTAGRGARLCRGMVIAIEPMVNIGAPDVKECRDGWTVVTRDGSLAAHYEHTVALTENGIELLTKLKQERAARVEAERKNAILTHVNKTYTMTEIAKELNMKSATELNKYLAEKKIQYKVNGTWVFYSDYSNLGYEDIKQEVLDSGKVIYHRKITQLGREFIIGLFEGKRSA